MITRMTRGEALLDVDGREARVLGEGLPVGEPGEPSWVAYRGSVTWTDGGPVSEDDRTRVVDLLVTLMAAKGGVVDVEQ